jgi:hypothetical protein
MLDVERVVAGEGTHDTKEEETFFFPFLLFACLFSASNSSSCSRAAKTFDIVNGRKGSKA